MARSGGETMEKSSAPIFKDISGDDPDLETTTIESLCMDCGKNGMTKLLLTKIPFYKDVIIMSFNCEHCGCHNNELQSGGKIAERGIKISLNVKTPRDFNRQVVKSDYTSVKIPSLDFEIPSQSQKGEVTTVEGVIERAIAGLEQDQDRRREENPEAAVQIDLFLAKLRELKLLKDPFQIIIEDISGNSFIENPFFPNKDEQCTIRNFKRTREQDKQLGIFEANEDVLLKPIREDEYPLEEIEGEVLSFPTNCPDCNAPCETNMKMTNIPHFKEVVIMATNCESCGHRTNEVKSGGGMEPRGVRIEVAIAGKEDFSRDILKSENCSLEIPELDMDVGGRALGGRFTTVEGLIVAAKEQLSSSPFTGDSSDVGTAKRMDEFMKKMDVIVSGDEKFTLILDDPTGNSYVQSLSDDGQDDKLKITRYERTFEQNEELGLNDMKVDNY